MVPLAPWYLVHLKSFLRTIDQGDTLRVILFQFVYSYFSVHSAPSSYAGTPDFRVRSITFCNVDWPPCRLHDHESTGNKVVHFPL